MIVCEIFWEIWSFFHFHLHIWNTYVFLVLIGHSYWHPIIPTSFCQDNCSESSSIMPEEFGKHLIKDQRPFLPTEYQNIDFEVCFGLLSWWTKIIPLKYQVNKYCDATVTLITQKVLLYHNTQYVVLRWGIFSCWTYTKFEGSPTCQIPL